MNASRDIWQIAQVEAALNEADDGDFVPESKMAAKLEQLGIQELNRITDDHGLLSDDWKDVEQIMERVRQGEEALYPLSDVERELGLDGDTLCR